MNMDYPEVLVNNADHWGGGGFEKKNFSPTWEKYLHC